MGSSTDRLDLILVSGVVDAETSTMLTTDEVRAEIARFTYRPGWTFEVQERGYEGLRLRIVARGVVNGYHPDEMVDLGINEFIPPFSSGDHLGEWLLWRLLRIESHECREFLRRDGKLYRDPHADD